MESVPDAVRGRVFGIFVMSGGVLGNLSHWLVGLKVRQLGPAAFKDAAYHPLYAGLAIMLLCSLSGLLCLNPIRRREAIKPGVSSSETVALMS